MGSRRVLSVVVGALLSVALVAGPGTSSADALRAPILGPIVGPVVDPILGPIFRLLGIDFDQILDDAVAALPLPDLSDLPDLAPGGAPALTLPAIGKLPLLPNLGPLLPLPLLPDLDGLLPPVLPLPDPVTLPGLPTGIVVPALPSLGDLPLPLPEQLTALLIDLRIDEVVAGGGTRTTTARLAPFSPATIDTDGDSADGAEILALATIGTDGLTLRVEQLPGATSPYLAQVVGTLTDPTNASSRYSLGFDGRSSGAPRAVDIGALLASGGGSVTIRTAEPTAELDLVARMVVGGVETLAARAGFAPVPATTVIGLADERITLDVSQPSVLDLELLEGDRTTTAHIDRLPRSLAVERQRTAGSERLVVTASDRIALADLGVVEPGSVARLHLADVPTSVSITRSSDAVSVEAPGRIGTVELELGTGGPAPTLPDPAYVHVTDDGLAARLTGLTEAVASIGGSGPLRVVVAADPGPFRFLLEEGGRLADISVLDLPGRVEATLDPDDGTLAYDASAPIGRIEASFADPGGLGGGLTTLDLLLVDLPPSLTVSFGIDGEGISLDAGGARIGLVEVSGNGATLAGAGDGLVLDGSGLAARLTGLRELRASVVDPIRMLLRKDPGPFTARIADGSRLLELEVVDVPDLLDITIDPAAGFTMRNSAPIGRVSAHVVDPAGIVGRATDLRATLLDLPAEIALAFDTDGGLVSLDAGGAAIGLVDVVATSTPSAPEAVAAGSDGLVFRDTPAGYGLAVRLTGLRSATAGTRATDGATIVALDKAAGRFTLHLTQGSRVVDAVFADLPATVNAALSASGDLGYTASAPIARVDASLVDPAGVSGRATRLSATLVDLPASLELAIDAIGSSVSLDAHGARIGSVQINLADATTAFPAIAGSDDGVTIVDLPTAYAIAGRLTGLRRASVSLGTTPITAALQKDPGPFRVRLDQAARQAAIDVLDLPSNLSATIDPAGSLSYAASAPILQLDLDLTDPAGVAGRAVRADVTLTGLPTALSLAFAGSGDQVTIDAGTGSIGGLDLLLTSGPDLDVPAGSDGVLLSDTPASYVVAARLTGLRRLTGNLSTVPIRLDITKAPGPFGVDYTNGSRVVTADIVDLPSVIDVSFDPAGAIAYTASSPIGLITAELNDPTGIGGRYRRAVLRLEGLPASLDVGFSGAGGAFQVDGRGATIGRIDALLTSGPEESIPAGRDGIIQRDLADRAVTVVRLTGLQQASVEVGPPTTAFIRSTGAQRLVASLQSLEGTKVETITADLSSLPTQVNIVVPTGSSNITYSGSQEVASLAFSTNAGARVQMDATLVPVPTALTVCTASDNSCFRFPNEGANAGSVLLAASGHTTVNLFDCTVGPCTNPAEALRVTNLNVRHLGFQANTSSTGSSGYVSLDTNNHALRGFVELRTGGGLLDPRINARFGNAAQTTSLFSENRIGRWEFFGVSQSKSGSVSCGGSDLSVTLFGINIGLTGFLC